MTGLFDSAQYPHNPGHRGIETSVVAAEALAPKRPKVSSLVLGAIRGAGSWGLTTDECCETLEMDRFTVQPRTSELRAQRLVADSGRRRKNRTGKSAIVWIAAEHMPAEQLKEAA
jgi:hypothetical protein